MAGSFFEIENRVGSPIQAGEYRLLPISRVLILKFPWVRGGIIWNRPVSVVAQTAGGQEQVLPVRDITRQVQLALFAGTLVSVVAMSLIRKRIEKRTHRE